MVFALSISFCLHLIGLILSNILVNRILVYIKAFFFFAYVKLIILFRFTEHFPIQYRFFLTFNFSIVTFCLFCPLFRKITGKIIILFTIHFPILRISKTIISLIFFTLGI